jgi:hypothetical protein
LATVAENVGWHTDPTTRVLTPGKHDETVAGTVAANIKRARSDAREAQISKGGR